MILLDKLFGISDGSVSLEIKRRLGSWPKSVRLAYFKDSKRVIRFFDTAVEAEIYIQSISGEEND